MHKEQKLYTENTLKDVVLFSKAFLSNQLAKISPKIYVALTHQTGRGREEDDAQQIANYFIECFHDYRKHLNLNKEDFKSYLNKKTILEYGPGDILGVALLFYAYGANRVHAVDQFPLSKMSKKNVDVYLQIFNSLEKNERERAKAAFNENGKPESGFNTNAINYQITKNGLSNVHKEYDLVISRAVLEHVSYLKETILDIKHSMKDDGVSLHQVDLKSHGLDRYTEFDFLTWPTAIYKLMYSNKGFPNRWRVDKYKELTENSGLSIKRLIPTGRIHKEKLNIIYPKIAKEFCSISSDELSWLGFWIVLEHA